MGKVLFLGNSHLAAYKLAYDAAAGAFPHTCVFFCARGADLAFTRVDGLTIVPTPRATLGRDALKAFFPDNVTASLEHRYLERGEPMADVATQFEQTGGSRTIDLTGVDAIFYAAGVSPYDVRRLEVQVAPRSAGLTRELFATLLRDNFLLREQVRAIRAAAPAIRHYFLGMPLRGLAPVSLSPQIRDIVVANRELAAAVARDYLFDDVFMPGPSVLHDDLVSSRAEFFVSGREQAETYQGSTPTTSDLLHANAGYAAVVLEEFIRPRLT